MSKLCSAYLSGRSFSLPRFGSKREEKTNNPHVVRPDELYGFLPKQEGAMRRTGTMPGRVKSSEMEAIRMRAIQKLTRHRSLLPGQRKDGSERPALPPRQPLKVQIPRPETVQVHRPDECAVVEVKKNPGHQRRDASPTKQQEKQLSPRSSTGPWCTSKLNTSLNSSGNSLNDSGIDSGVDSTRHTDSSRVSFSSYGSLYPSPRPSPPVYGINLRLQNASMSRPANCPLWVCRDYQPSAVERSKMRVISATRGEVVNALYRTNEWVMVRTSKDETGFIPFAYTELLDTRRLSQDFTQQYPEWAAPLWRPCSRSTQSSNHNDVESQSRSDCQSVSQSTPMPKQCSSRRYDPDLSVLEDCANVEFFHRLEPRLARDRNPVMLSSQVSLVPHIGSDVSYDVSDDVSYDYDYDDDDINSLDLSIDSTCTESSVFTVTDSGVQLTVLFTYTSTQENDICVEKGEIVLELNTDDPDWTWIRNEDGDEGFVPSTYVVNLRKLNLDPRAPTTYL